MSNALDCHPIKFPIIASVRLAGGLQTVHICLKVQQLHIKHWLCLSIIIRRGVAKSFGFWISSSRMTFKLILVLCLANVALGISFGSSRGYRCYIKSDSTKTFSNMLHTYGGHCGRVSCGRASNRVPKYCQGGFPKLTPDFVSKNICNKAAGITSNGQIHKVPIYLSGKADCKGNTDVNAWMDPVKKADVCCQRSLGNVVGCQKGSATWCNC